jgi:hypothetical protein
MRLTQQSCPLGDQAGLIWGVGRLRLCLDLRYLVAIRDLTKPQIVVIAAVSALVVRGLFLDWD